MRKILIWIGVIAIVFAATLLFYLWSDDKSKTLEVPTAEIGHKSSTNISQNQEIAGSLNEVTPGYRRYENEEWGFAFEYPEDWLVKENYFENYYSQFNILVTPITESRWDDPILINIVTPDFVRSSFLAYQDQKTATVFKGRKADMYNYEWQEMGMTDFIVPNFGNYSLILGSNEYYETEFAHFLDTFEFLE